MDKSVEAFGRDLLKRKEDAGKMPATQKTESDIEAEVDDVAVADDVFLSFKTDFARGAGGLFGAEGLEFVEGDGFGLNEAAFYVGVDFSCGVEGDSALMDGPGAKLAGDDGEKADEAQSRIAAMGEFENGGFGDAHISHKLGFRFGVKLGKLVFEFGANGNDAGAGWHHVGEGEFSGEVGLVRRGGFTNVDGDDHRLEGKKAQRFYHFELGVIGDCRTDGFFGFDCLLELFLKGKLSFVVRLSCSRFFCLFFKIFDARRNKGQIREQKLGEQFGKVFGGVDSAPVRRDGRVIEGADDRDEKVSGPDFFEEVLGGVPAVVVGEVEAGQVEAVHGGVNNLFGLVELGEPVKTRVRDGEHCFFECG